MKEYHNRPTYDITLYEWEEKTEKEIPHTLRAKILTPERTRKMMKLANDKKITNEEKVIEQMVILFGNEPKFYEKFDLFIMDQVLTEIITEIIQKKKK